MKLIFAINSLAAAAWLPIELTNTKGGFFVAEILILI
jgi:hypothetical protein